VPFSANYLKSDKTIEMKVSLPVEKETLQKGELSFGVLLERRHCFRHHRGCMAEHQLASLLFVQLHQILKRAKSNL